MLENVIERIEMELKAILEQPYTEMERVNFIVEQNQLNPLHYEIRETPEAIEAWGKTDEELLEKAKQEKYDEANSKAKYFLESGEALFEFEEGKHIEATDGNIGKFTAYALAYVTGQLQPTDTVVWNTKEDETVELTATQVNEILNGLGVVQASVWSVQFPMFLNRIKEARTLEEVRSIVIQYFSMIVPDKESEE